MSDPVERWFEARGWRAFDFQREVRQAYLAGESGLVHSATGTGKTLAAFLGPAAEAFAEGAQKAPPLRLLWITPMRALAGDTAHSLERAAQGVGLEWTVGLRTGDTPAAERARQARRLPTVLVTTPESLALMLSQAEARERLASVRAVVVDEWHELLGNKRGVQVELSLARLRRWNPALRTWGLSATLGNLDEALSRLLAGAPGRVVRGVSDKPVVIDTLIPDDVDRFPWAGHLGLAMLADVVAVLESSRSTLVFTNTRSQAEIWYQALLEARPDWAGLVALHHGSLDADARRWVEAGLKEGRLKAVVATSSLDLGVDFSPVERVLQIGSPKGVARLLQRAGRSGHAPGQTSRVSCVPAHALEFVEAAAARRAAQAGRIESRRPVARPLDVLTQHLVTIAAGEGFVEAELRAEVMSTEAFRELTDGEWRWALDFVTRGGESLKAYPEYRRVEEVDGWHVVRDAAIARRHRMSVGTIVSEASIDVRYFNGRRLGHVEESFIAWLSPGDAFVFAGHVLELVRVENMTALVRPAKPGSATVPRWQGGRSPLSSELAEGIRELLEDHLEGRSREPEMRAVGRLLGLQRRWSRIPRRSELLVEQCETREGHHVFVYPFEGRHVHVGLAALLAWRLARTRPASFSMSFNDYGFELLSRERFELLPLLRSGLLSPENLLEDVLASLNAAELSKRQFREIARVAGLVFQGYPGQPKSAKQVQATSGLLYEVFARWDAANPLLAQAEREVLERELEFSRLARAIGTLSAAPVVLRQTGRPTPFAFPLLVARLREKLTSE
ncbi:MAG TPA: ligase-associated DNA damage response DEXH box helicase, partial [Usitatibacteraceae bacterium]|nr:ligase-associated DNA damage response DEXH box helicase [Usitatibacteraceae bacterium]